MPERICSVNYCDKLCDRPHGARGLCAMHYQRWRRTGKLGDPPPTSSERFWAKVDRRGPDECWPWTDAPDPGGYGRFYLGSKQDGTGRMWTAHRVAYELTYEPLPPGFVPDHLCHTRDPKCFAGRDCPHRRCVNPSHLEAVSLAENNRRGHQPRAFVTHCPQGHPYDETNTYWRRGKRTCKACSREHTREWRARARDARIPIPESELLKQCS